MVLKVLCTSLILVVFVVLLNCFCAVNDPFNFNSTNSAPLNAFLFWNTKLPAIPKFPEVLVPSVSMVTDCFITGWQTIIWNGTIFCVIAHNLPLLLFLNYEL